MFSLERLPTPSLGDVMAYVGPGAFVAAYSYALEGWAIRNAMSYRAPLHSVAEIFGSGGDGVGHLLRGIAFALGLYILGHVIDMLAVLLIDRGLVFKGYGYAFEGLLEFPSESARVELSRIAEGVREARARGELPGDPHEVFQRVLSVTPLWTELSRAFYRGLLFWVSLYLGLRVAAILAEALVSPRWFLAFSYTAAAIGILGLQLAVTKFMLRKFQVQLHALQDRADCASDLAVKCRRLAKRLRRAFELPYELAARPLARVLYTRKSLGLDLRLKYERLFKERFRMDPVTADSNNHWLPLMFIILKSPRLASLLRQYERMNRFTRNLSMASLLTLVWSILWITHDSGDVARNGGFILAVAVGALLPLFLMLLLSYHYWYVCYYNKTLIRAFVFLAAPQNRSATEDAEALPVVPERPPGITSFHLRLIERLNLG